MNYKRSKEPFTHVLETERANGERADSAFVPRKNEALPCFDLPDDAHDVGDADATQKNLAIADPPTVQHKKLSPTSTRVPQRPLPPRPMVQSELPISEKMEAATPAAPPDAAPTSREGRAPNSASSSGAIRRTPSTPSSLWGFEPTPPLHRDQDQEHDASAASYDETEVHSAASSSELFALRVGFPAPQFSAPRVAQPFTIPSAPITRKLLPDGSEEDTGNSMLGGGGAKPLIIPNSLHLQSDLAPTSRRPATAPTLSEYVPTPTRRRPHETPSLTPVAMSTSLGYLGGSRADMTTQLRPQRGHRSPWIAASLAFFIASSLAGVVLAVIALTPGRAWFGHGNTAAAKAVSAPDSAATFLAAPAPPPTTIIAPTTTYVPVPPVSAELPPSAQPVIEADQTLVTFPPAMKGHRIFVDGRALTTVSATAPTPVKCGKHRLQVGSSGKAQLVELPCGGEFTIE